MESKKKILMHGITQNPAFVLVLGMCPLMAQTTTFMNSFLLGVATMICLTFSNLFISLLRKIIPDKVRLPAYIVVIATFSTLIAMVIQKFLPDLYLQIGASLGLVVTNCIILGRAEAFASKNTVLNSVLDGLSMGVGFTLVAALIGIVREVLVDLGVAFFGSRAGAFLTLALLMAIFNFVKPMIEKAFSKKRSLMVEEVKA